MPIYYVKCKNLISYPSIEVTFNIQAQYLTDVLQIVESAFASVDVIDRDTGEIIATRYTSYELHRQFISVGEALLQLNDYIIGPEDDCWADL